MAREVLGPDQPDTLAGISADGYAALALGDHPAAETAYRELLALTEARFTAMAPIVVVAKNNLASALIAQKKWGEAEAILRALHSALAAARGPEHFETLAVLHGLGTMLKDAKRYDEALPVLEEVLAVRRRTIGNEDESTLRSMRNLGLLYAELRRFEDADALLTEAVDTARRVLPETNFLTGDLLHMLGSNLAKMARFADAEPLLLEGHAWLARTLGPDKPATRRAAAELHAVYQRQGKAAEAAEWEARAQAR